MECFFYLVEQAIPLFGQYNKVAGIHHQQSIVLLLWEKVVIVSFVQRCRCLSRDVRGTCTTILLLNHIYENRRVIHATDTALSTHTVFSLSWELCVRVPPPLGDGDCRALAVTAVVLCSEKGVSDKQL